MIPRHIFREYDIRGLHETELTDPVAEAVGRAFGSAIVRGTADAPRAGWTAGFRSRAATTRPSSTASR